MIGSRKKNPIIDLFKSMINHGLENMGRYYSVYRAWVYDNNDPEHLQRLKLIIPDVGGTQAYDYWAFTKNTFYGPGYGMQLLPQQGDVVWVEFEGGNPSVPVWSHGHPAKKEMPKDDKDLQDPNCYWFVTPRGHKIKINDTKNYIHIETRLGEYVEINENGISVVTKNKEISLGGLDGSHSHAVLGEELKDLLTDINKVLSKLHGAMVKDLPLYTSLGFANAVTAIPLVKIEVSTLTEKLDKILSKKVTLD